MNALLRSFCLALLLCACGGGGSDDAAPPAAPPTEEVAWRFERSVGLPPLATPSPEGWFFDFPQPTAAVGHVHHLVRGTESLVGKTKIVARVKIGGTGRLVPTNFPSSPPLLALFLQRRGDNWSGVGTFETYRWFASFSTITNVGVGEYLVEARFDQNWTAVSTSSRASNPAAFHAALADPAAIGFAFGGGDGRAHGVYATGPIRFWIVSFKVE